MNETIQCNHWNNHVDTQTYIIRHNNLRRYNNNGDNNDERSIESTKKQKYFTCQQEQKLDEPHNTKERVIVPIEMIRC